MKLLHRVSDLFLFGNLYVALGAAFLVQSTRIQLGMRDPLAPYSVLVFFATLFVYNFQRIFYRPDEGDISPRRAWIIRNRQLVRVLSLCGALGVLVSLFRNDFRVVLYLSPLLLLSIGYFAKGIRLRNNPWVKLATLVGVWTMVTAVVPVLLGPHSLSAPENVLHIFIRLLFMLGICLPFDIRDIPVDKAAGVTTIPQIIGVRNTRNIAVACMLLYTGLLVPEYLLGMFHPILAAALFITAVLNTFLVALSNERRREYFYVAAIDGTMILQGGILLAAEQVTG